VGSDVRLRKEEGKENLTFTINFEMLIGNLGAKF
jgi:hypothetical protein